MHYGIRDCRDDQGCVRRLGEPLVVCAVLIALAQTMHGQAGPRDYPQWRGRNGDGAASAFAPPRVWPEALTRRWRVEVGEGYATPLVVGDLAYVFAQGGGSEVMIALDAATGVEKWRSGYEAPYTPSAPTAAHGAGPKATPIFHEGKLFTLGISGIVTALDAATGRRLWQIAAPAEHPFFSAASSPVGAKGIVLFHPGNYGPLTAFDANTGATPSSSARRMSERSPSGPCAASIPGRPRRCGRPRRSGCT